MSDRIKGITIEIDGDTTQLNKALKQSNTQIRDTQKKLREVNKALKLDPKSTVALTQKQKLLKQAIDDTKDRLKTLKAAEVQAAEQLKNGDIGQEEFDALQLEIAETEAKLKNAQKAFREFGSVGKQKTLELADSINKVSEKATQVGTALSKGVTAPIVALGTASVAAFKDVDSGLDTIIKKTGATGAEFEAYKDIAESLAQSMPVDFDKIGTAVGEVSTRFNVTGKELQSMSEQFIKFTELNGGDLTSTIDTVQNAMSAFGLSASDASKFLDVMNRTGQNTGVSMETLENGLVKNSTAFQEMGLSIEESVNLMGQIAKSGSDDEAVLSGLKRALKSAAKEGKPLGTALAELEDNIRNGTDSMDGLTLAYEMFGKSGDQIYGALKNGTVSFKDLASSADILNDSLGSVNKTYDATLDPMDQAKVVGNDMKLTLAELGEVVVYDLTPALETIADALKGAKDWFSGLEDGTQKTIVNIGLFAAAIGPALIVLGKLGTGLASLLRWFGNVQGAIAPATTAIGNFATAVGVSSAGLIAGIGAIAAGFGAVIAILVNGWGDMTVEFKREVGVLLDTWNNFKAGVANGVNGIKTGFQSIVTTVSNLKNKIVAEFDAIKSKISSVVESIRNPFKNLNWSLPHIKLPHFSISGRLSLDPPSIPRINVSWYKKAMDSVQILDGAQIFGAAGGHLLGGGEAGREVVAGEAHLVGLIQNSVNNVLGNRVDRLINLVSSIATNGTDIYIDSTRVAKATYSANNAEAIRQSNFNKLINGVV